MGLIVYNGISSNDVGVVIERYPAYQTPSKDYERIHVPGRNGDVIVDKGSYQNVNRAYNIAFGSYTKTHSEMANAVSEWLHSASGYARLEDSYEPEYYRMALYEEDLELENILNRLGRAKISFNCKPQRFLKSGERPIVFTNSGTVTNSVKIHNPTRFQAFPIITLIGSGAARIRVGDYLCNISDIDGVLTLDCEFQNAYYDAQNKNSLVSLPNGFPKLGPGLTQIVFSGENVTRVEVIPKWWTL